MIDMYYNLTYIYNICMYYIICYLKLINGNDEVNKVRTSI